MIVKNILVALPLLASSFSFAQKNTPEKRLDSLFTALAEQNQFSGSVLIAEKGTVLYKSGKGYSNEQTKAKNNPQTIFELASCSKQFIGVGMALLHRDHAFAYTDDITNYLPELTSFKGVTLYDLLHHTSGIPDFFGEFSDQWEKEHPNQIATNQDVIAYFAAHNTPLQFTPASQHRYCNANYLLLATIIERVSNQPIDTYLSEKIFQPLGMTHTFMYNRRLSPKQLDNYAFGYVWAPNSFEKVPQDDPKVGQMLPYLLDGIVGNAKVNSTVEDLYRWMNAIKNNQLLTPEEFNEVMAITQTTANKDVQYGFGFDVRKGSAGISYGHTGSWDGYITFMYYSPANDRTIIVLNNFNNGVSAYATIREILDNKPSSHEFVKKVPMKEKEMRKFTGTYVDAEQPEESHVITYLDGHLVYNTTKANWDMRFFPSSPTTFEAIRQGGTNGVMTFTPQADGTMKLEMTQYGRVIGTGIRQK